MTAIYLDYAATTPVDPQVAEIMRGYLTMDGLFANPSSTTHHFGWDAREAVEGARAEVASLVKAKPEEIKWTSGATEAINLAIVGAALFYQRQGRHLITLMTEHRAGLAAFEYLEKQGFEVSYLPVESDGLIDMNRLASSIKSDTTLLSAMHVNNETGAVQPIEAIAALTREKGVVFHVDAAQSAGKLPIDLSHLSIDLMSFSSHKLYGPKGIGALFVSSKPCVRLEPITFGGNQEHGLRSGTLATHQIVGMGKAFKLAEGLFNGEKKRLEKFRQLFLATVEQLPGVHFNGSREHYVPGIVNLSFEGVHGEALLYQLASLAISTGSACASSKEAVSHVLDAMGLHDELIQSAMRFSFGRFTTESEVQEAGNLVVAAVRRLRNLSPLFDQQSPCQ